MGQTPDNPLNVEDAFESLLENTSFAYLQEHRPLLAHYTSVANLESILRTGELWLSNPLLSNDYEEVRFGVRTGVEIFDRMFAEPPDFCTSAEWECLKNSFHEEMSAFDSRYAADVYVACFFEHPPNNTDGVLSMWRGYGGRGSGAAILFSTEPLLEPDPEHPMALVKINYGTWDQRKAYISSRLEAWAEICRNIRFDAHACSNAASAAFRAILYSALSWKHVGFKEENEWRAIYYAQSDEQDLVTSQLSYSIVGTAIEPRLKYRIAPATATSNQRIEFSELVHSIILGPMISSELALVAARRMIAACGKSFLCDRVTASKIPFREKSG